jgi:hypothetical protein
MVATAAITVGCGGGAHGNEPAPILTAPARPTHTPTATATPTATPTPEPTATPIPPTATPAPRLAPVAPVAPGGRAAAAAPTGGDFEALVALYDWPVAQALAVAWCESGYRNVQNGGGGPYFGPFQMWSGHFRPGEDYWHVPTNVAVAYRVWRSSGWSPWECKP